MFKALKLALAVTVVGLAGHGANRAEASFSVVWDFTNQEGNQASQSPTLSTPFGSLSASNMTRTGVGVASIPSFAGGAFAANDWVPQGDTNRYIQFDVTSTGADTLTFNSLTFSSRATNNAPGNMELRWSNDNWVSSFEVDTFKQIGENTTNFALNSSELGAAGLSDVGGTVSFRILSLVGLSAGAEESNLNPAPIESAGIFALLDSLNIDGVVNSPTAIPEPTSLLMVAAAGLAGGFVVRRRRMAAGQASNCEANPGLKTTV